MKFKYKCVFAFLVILSVLLFIYLYSYAIDSAVLNPKGIIALYELHLMTYATLLMLIVVVPVLILAFAICLRYRASNKKAQYLPNWNHDIIAEAIWWGFPLFIVIILSIFTWESSHSLDPFRPLEKSVKPLKIQAVALQWKWLFLYPEQKIATVNYVQFPSEVPLSFEITADAPMNSFWIPELGGQIYAMPGMTTRLHLIADDIGAYRGSSANLSGTGFSGMSFEARSTTKEEFEEWAKNIAQSQNSLSLEEYNILRKPSEYVPSSFYQLKDVNLFDQIVMKYMMPMPQGKMP